MPSIKLIHYTKKVYTDGTSPVILQIISGKVIKRKVLTSVRPEQWNDKNKEVRKHNSAASLNDRIWEEFKKYQAIVNAIPDGADISNIFGTKKKDDEKKQLTFWEIAEIYISTNAKSYFTAGGFRSKVRLFKNFIGQDDFYLSDIDSRILYSYIKSMRDSGNNENSIRGKIKVLRFIAKFAHESGMGDKPEALFSIKLPKEGRTLKNKLEKSELEALEQAPASKIAGMCRDAFLLAVYLRGMRISDVLQLKESYFRDGRIRYFTQKTGKPFDIKLTEKAQKIVDRYKDGSEYLFPLFQFEYDKKLSPEENEKERVTIIKRATSRINKNLKLLAEKAGIKKKISTHIARHTFAKMAADKISDRRVTMELLGHSSLAVHEAYISDVLSTDELDSAADDIFS